MAQRKITKSTINSANNYYYTANNKNQRKRRRSARKNKTHRPGSSPYLDLGFFQQYNEQERKDNLFFVLEHGLSKKNRIAPGDLNVKVQTSYSAAIKALENAGAISEKAETNFLSDFTSFFKTSGTLRTNERLLEVLQTYGLRELFEKSNYTSADVEQFFNSKLFSPTSGITADTSLVDANGQTLTYDTFDTYYMKIHDMAFGFKNALKKARNMAEAREILSRKFDEYLGGMGTNVVTKVSGLGSMLGEFKNIDPNIIAEIKEQIINEFMEQTLKLPEGDLSNFDYNLVKSEDEEGLLKLETGNDQIHGSFQEMMEEAMRKALDGLQIELTGGNLAILSTRTGNESSPKNSSKFRQMSGLSDEEKMGRTDVKLIYSLDRPKYKTNYQINISDKMVQGYSRSKDKKTIGKSKASKQAHLYHGGQLGVALDRLTNSSLFDRGGAMTEEDFNDIVFMTINAAQGGIYQDARPQLIQIYGALTSFLSMDEMSNDLGFNNLFNGDSANDGINTSSTIINLISINGYYIPASLFFKAVKKKIQSNGSGLYHTSITFANTFPESTSSGQAYIQGYMDWIQDNHLNYGTPFEKNNVTVGSAAGSPQKVQANILQNTKIGGLDLKWSGSINTFWGELMKQIH